MEKRRLRVLNSLGTVLPVGICTLCNREFEVPMTATKRVGDAQANLTAQFAEHTCKGAVEEQTLKDFLIDPPCSLRH
jgi:hypothetical protein